MSRRKLSKERRKVSSEMQYTVIKLNSKRRVKN